MRRESFVARRSVGLLEAKLLKLDGLKFTFEIKHILVGGKTPYLAPTKPSLGAEDNEDAKNVASVFEIIRTYDEFHTFYLSLGFSYDVKSTGNKKSEGLFTAKRVFVEPKPFPKRSDMAQTNGGQALSVWFQEFLSVLDGRGSVSMPNAVIEQLFSFLEMPSHVEAIAAKYRYTQFPVDYRARTALRARNATKVWVLKAGELLSSVKGRLRNHFFVLTDTLRYYASEDEYLAGVAAEGTVNLDCFFLRPSPSADPSAAAGGIGGGGDGSGNNPNSSSSSSSGGGGGGGSNGAAGTSVTIPQPQLANEILQLTIVTNSEEILLRTSNKAEWDSWRAVLLSLGGPLSENDREPLVPGRPRYNFNNPGRIRARLGGGQGQRGHQNVHKQ